MVHWSETGNSNYQINITAVTQVGHSTLARRYRADRMYGRPRLRGVVYTDTMHGHFKSLDGNKYAQIFTTEDYFAAAYPMESKALAGDALKEFITDYGGAG